MIVLRALALAALALERAHAFGDVRELNDETFDSVVDGSACGHAPLRATTAARLPRASPLSTPPPGTTLKYRDASCSPPTTLPLTPKARDMSAR